MNLLLIKFLTRVKVEKCNFYVLSNCWAKICTHVRKNDRYRVWFFKFYLLTRGESFFRSRKPVRAIEFYVLSGVRITCLWIAFTLIFYWRESGHAKSCVLTRFTCMWGSCLGGLTCICLPAHWQGLRFVLQTLRAMNSSSMIVLVTLSLLSLYLCGKKVIFSAPRTTRAAFLFLRFESSNWFWICDCLKSFSSVRNYVSYCVQSLKTTCLLIYYFSFHFIAKAGSKPSCSFWDFTVQGKNDATHTHTHTHARTHAHIQTQANMHSLPKATRIASGNLQV